MVTQTENDLAEVCQAQTEELKQLKQLLRRIQLESSIVYDRQQSHLDIDDYALAMRSISQILRKAGY